ncbi:MAG: PHP domain-containing protein [Promethearchaeota archaeon]
MKFIPKNLPHGLKYDMHLHSQFSDDSLVDIRKIPKMAIKKGLAGLAITDHNTLRGYRYLKKHAEGLTIIPGMEVETEIGEVIGLFITEEINTSLTDYFEIIDDIRDKNGLVVVPHPFDSLRSNHLKIQYLSNEEIKNTIDGIEIVNARIINKNHIFKAMSFQEYFDFFKTGGSDAHTLGEIGNAFTFIPTDEDVNYLSEDEIKKMLKNKLSESYGKQSNPLVHAITVIYKLRKKIL